MYIYILTHIKMYIFLCIIFLRIYLLLTFLLFYSANMYAKQ